MARVRLVNLETASETVKNNIDASRLLFVGAGVVNSESLMAHTPHISKFISCIVAAMQREGAGSILSGKIKSVADIKTSSVNTCAY